MSFQQVRGAFESATAEALVLAGISPEQICFDNTAETPPDAATNYAVVALSFDRTAIDVVSCSTELIRGSLMVNVYTPKQQGSRPGEDVAAEVLRAWAGLNTAPQTPTRPRVQNIDGPRTIAPDQRPHHCHTISCSFTARAQ